MPDPIIERLAKNVATALGRMTKTNGYSGDFKVVRATTSNLDTSPSDLKTEIWEENPEPVPAPWGQSGWRLDFAICIYIREAEDSGFSIDQRLNLAFADSQKALMADPRRTEPSLGGLCHVDNEFLKPSIIPGTDGFSSIWCYLRCEYRTLRNDPYTLAPAASNQSFFQGGAVLYVAPLINDRSLGPWRRFDNLKVTPLLEPRTDLGQDDRDGLSHPFDEQFVGFTQKYELDSDYLNLDVLTWQLGGGPVETFSQSATPLVEIQHAVLAIDSVIPLQDASGNAVFGVTSIQSVKDHTGATTYVADTDYIADADSLREGAIKIPATSAIPPNSAILISFTPLAATGRPAFDIGVACKFHVKARLIWRSADGQMMVQPDFKASLVAQSVTDGETAAVTTKLNLTVLDDGSDKPAGRFILPFGALPTAGF